MTETTSGAEWFTNHRDEFESQRDVSVALLATIKTAAAQQAETKQIVAVEQRFVDDVDRLTSIRQRLDNGQPEDTLPRVDQTFLHGFTATGQRRRAFGGSRRTRWPRAIASLPTPRHDASEHVVNLYATRRDEIEHNLRSTVMHCVMQDFRWHQELARRELGKRPLKHAKFCDKCDLAAWSFLLDLPPYLHPWDKTGNYKPHKPAEADPEAEPDDG